MKSMKIKIRRAQSLAAVFIVLLILFIPLAALAGGPGDPPSGDGPDPGVTGGGPDVQIGNPADVPPSSGEPGSAFPDQQQSLAISPEQPLTTLPATGGAIFPALALGLLLAGSGVFISRKFKEH